MTKGVAILLMVLVHARFSHYGDTYINMFHMPLFFFMSGYCFKDSYLNDFRGYIWKRIKGAYWPFVKWGLLSLLLHNVFYSLNIYNGEYGFRVGVSHLYATKDFWEHAKTIVMSMSGSEQLLGGYWFLHSYFIAALIVFPIILVLHRKWFVLVGGGGILLILSVLFCRFNYSVSRYLSDTELLSAFFMVIGYVYRQSKWKIEEHPQLVIPIGAGIVALGAHFWPCAMLKLEWMKVMPYAFSALAGTLMVFSFCKLLFKSSVALLTKPLSYLGDKTLDILTWHFLCFKACSLIIIVVYTLPVARLAEFPVIEEYAYQGWWLPYFIIGITGSVLITFTFNQFIGLVNTVYLSIKLKNAEKKDYTC